MGQKVDNDLYMTTQRAKGSVDEQSGRINSARDGMENFQNDMQSIFGVLGGLLKGIMGMLGKGGGKGG